MPIHDWTHVTAGTWHSFHLGWVSEIRLVMNTELLPSDYYVQTEQLAGPFRHDVPTVQTPEAPEPQTNGSLAAEAEMDAYVPKRRTLVIRHESDDRIVALLEILSPGNKSSRNALRTFVEKAL